MEKLEIRTPAKINLGLNIIGKRTDGYHNIETIFYPIGLFDKLTFYKSGSFSFRCKNFLLEADKNNSVIKAVEILKEETGEKINCLIELEKNIPVGAGMGGGSSDGAVALLTLNKFFDLRITIKRLEELALKIGSDVPFFINPNPCLASSRGELMTGLNFTIPFPILIVNPGIHVSTKWAYENIKPTKPRQSLLEIFNSQINDFSKLKNFVKNDFEEIIFKKFPAIEEIKKSLYECGALFALMTGSGSTVFGIFKDLVSARKAQNIFSKKYFTFIHNE